MLRAFSMLLLLFGIFGLCVSQSCNAKTGSASSHLLESPVCEYCKDTVKQLNELAFTDKAKKAFTSIIHHVCENLPFTTECESILEKVYAYLDDQHNKCKPEKFCYLIHLCPKEDSCELEENKLDCDACTMVVGKIQGAMKNPSFRKMIVAVLKEFCHSIPDENLKQKCNTYVDGPVVEWLDKMTEKLNPNAVCQVIGLCDKAVKAMLFRSDESNVCDTCIAFVSRVKEFIKNQQVIDAVNQAIDRICTLAMVYERQCSELLHGYFDQFRKDMDKLSGKEFCQKIHAC